MSQEDRWIANETSGERKDWARYVYGTAGQVLKEQVRKPTQDAASTTNYTYDHFSRVKSVQLPDRTGGNMTTTYQYSGARSKNTTSEAVKTGSADNDTSASMWTEWHDGLGRLRRVNDTIARADYTYDAAGHMINADIRGASGTQTREFRFDGRGFAQVVRYEDDNRFNLRMKYDRAARLIEVRSINSDLINVLAKDKWLLQYRYYQQSTATAGTAGRLRTAARRKVVPTVGALGTSSYIDVTKTYTYDPAGRPWQLKLESPYNGASPRRRRTSTTRWARPRRSPIHRSPRPRTRRSGWCSTRTTEDRWRRWRRRD